MISVTELRAGRVFRLQGQPCQVIDYKHTKMGRGTANIKVKVRNLRNGAVIEKTFISGTRVEPIETYLKTLQYLYRDDDYCYFMDPVSFEQLSLPRKVFNESLKFLKEGGQFKIFFADDQPLSCKLPDSMIFEVIKAAPGAKGNTVSGNATKLVVLDNGLEIRAPLFVRTGNRVKIDTRTGEYVSRER